MKIVTDVLLDASYLRRMPLPRKNNNEDRDFYFFGTAAHWWNKRRRTPMRKR